MSDFDKVENFENDNDFQNINIEDDHLNNDENNVDKDTEELVLANKKEFKSSFLYKVSIRRRIFNLLEPRRGNFVGFLYDLLISAVALISIVPLLFGDPSTNKILSFIIDHNYIWIGIFVIDYLLRWFVADFSIRKGFRSFLFYPFQLWSIINLIGILPSLLGQTGSIFQIFITFRLFKVFKLFPKIDDGINFVFKSLFREWKILVVIGFALVFITFVGSIFIFQIEKADNSNINNFFDSIWFVFITITTIGYGDISPVTDLGRTTTIIFSLVGISIIALITATVVSGFTSELNERRDRQQQLKEIREDEYNIKRKFAKTLEMSNDFSKRNLIHKINSNYISNYDDMQLLELMDEEYTPQASEMARFISKVTKVFLNNNLKDIVVDVTNVMGSRYHFELKIDFSKKVNLNINLKNKLQDLLQEELENNKNNFRAKYNRIVNFAIIVKKEIIISEKDSNTIILYGVYSDKESTLKPRAKKILSFIKLKNKNNKLNEKNRMMKEINNEDLDSDVVEEKEIEETIIKQELKENHQPIPEEENLEDKENKKSTPKKELKENKKSKKEEKIKNKFDDIKFELLTVEEIKMILLEEGYDYKYSDRKSDLVKKANNYLKSKK